ncbi:MAG: Metal-dependent hydrolase YbeY, involved in rRNA and/or ribosome maturation and assembly [Ignavibacteriae bacterium]|nr:MAG: Metal-dependent hydrolase YbeY, involved in rRNA and/or ribosome maturation and assembly [Ignavibacteriota bacterium]
MISVFNNTKEYRIVKKETISLVKNVLKAEKVKKANINIIFDNDEFMLYLNKNYLKHNWITDVISFQFGEKNKIDGEVYIGLQQAERQAQTYNVEFSEEVSRLVIHGVLHLIGYDDNKIGDRKLMRSKENLYLKKFEKINARKNS